MTAPNVLEQARAWIAEDPDEKTSGELNQLVLQAEHGQQDAIEELNDRFGASLQFGTAGLRGALGGGPNRMNRVVVLRAAAGLAKYLQDTGANAPVVIGYDARHNSEVFARDTAEVMAGAGIEALLLPHPLPTPVLAFSILDLGCSAGVMVTASHNPAIDNGYKVYLGDGSQIVPPADHEIAERIAAVGALADIPRGDGYRTLDESVVERYLTSLAAVPPDGPRDLKLVYTAMHGVGGAIAVEAFARAGFAAPAVVQEQQEPDPEFPTVAFPNPEEPGAIDLSLALAAQTGADLVIANDPDADRCAAAVPDANGEWRMLRGDEVGALLAHDLLSHDVNGTYATSIVSSSLLGRMAEEHNQTYVETLTGFKWIGRLEHLVFGYEEALGYCVDPVHVKDKDGLSAMLRLAALAADLKASGKTLNDRLDEIATRFGLHATDQLSVRVDDLSVIGEVMERLRSNPPASVGGFDVATTDDLSQGSADLPPTDGLRYYLEGSGDVSRARVIVRPSGTEPKLKTYLEVVVPVTSDVDAARTAARTALDQLRDGFKEIAGL